MGSYYKGECWWLLIFFFTHKIDLKKYLSTYFLSYQIPTTECLKHKFTFSSIMKRRVSSLHYPAVENEACRQPAPWIFGEMNFICIHNQCKARRTAGAHESCMRFSLAPAIASLFGFPLLFSGEKFHITLSVIIPKIFVDRSLNYHTIWTEYIQTFPQEFESHSRYKNGWNRYKKSFVMLLCAQK